MASTEPPVFGPVGKEGDVDGFAIAAIDWEAGVLDTLEAKLKRLLPAAGGEEAPIEETIAGATAATPAETERAQLMEEIDRLGEEKEQLREKKLALLRQQQSPKSSGAGVAVEDLTIEDAGDENKMRLDEGVSTESSGEPRVVVDYLRFPAAGVEAEASTFVLPDPPSPCAAAVGAAVLESLMTSRPSMDSLPGLISPSEEEMLAAFSYDDFSPSPYTTSSPPASPPSPAHADDAAEAGEDPWPDCDGNGMDSPPLKGDTTSVDAATEAGSSISSSSVSDNELDHVLPAFGLPPSPASARGSSPDETVA
ncbi:hypothetical protein Esi_0027_0138 [Ectocarpus siliculosus]|uniref:Uncharacterized protein n=1 Tax=Ectocarpus siliculosus TaxID=2880 RepID=D7FUG2_ECTSI|nr:hypothetical protein Esi_0027_0138 [Ectocarpus siliculosus]|eukprot:CBJ26232.1 hypothetical protein Esi_0027_0138 [Ectocarpus siliculosus]